MNSGQREAGGGNRNEVRRRSFLLVRRHRRVQVPGDSQAPSAGPIPVIRSITKPQVRDLGLRRYLDLSIFATPSACPNLQERPGQRAHHAPLSASRALTHLALCNASSVTCATGCPAVGSYGSPASCPSAGPAPLRRRVRLESPVVGRSHRAGDVVWSASLRDPRAATLAGTAGSGFGIGTANIPAARFEFPSAGKTASQAP